MVDCLMVVITPLNKLINTKEKQKIVHTPMKTIIHFIRFLVVVVLSFAPIALVAKGFLWVISTVSMIKILL
jgi:hypothetical protein